MRWNQEPRCCLSFFFLFLFLQKNTTFIFFSYKWIGPYLASPTIWWTSHSPSWATATSNIEFLICTCGLPTNRAQSCLVSQIRWECLGCYDHELRQEVCYSLPETNTKNLALQISVNMMETEYIFSFTQHKSIAWRGIVYVCVIIVQMCDSVWIFNPRHRRILILPHLQCTVYFYL